MGNFRLIVITGLPGTGKTTLARELAATYALPLISKDTIKEELMDMLDSRMPSRALSDVSFALMFALAREQLTLGCSLILEGNFRHGEHEPPMLRILPADRPIHVVQVLCQLDEALRRAHLLRRAEDPTRHPGHHDAQQLEPTAACDSFLELPGDRRIYRVGSQPCETFF